MRPEDVSSDTRFSSSNLHSHQSVVTLATMTTTSLTDVSSISFLSSKKIEDEDEPTRSSDTLKVNNERPNSTKTCSCSTCTCSTEPVVLKRCSATSQHRSRIQLPCENRPTFKIKKKKFDHLYDNDDCLTHAFVTIFESSIWCMQFVYELFFKALWQALLFTKQELNRGGRRHRGEGDHRTLSGVDIISINQSARVARSAHHHRELPRRRLSLLDCQQQIQDQSKLKSLLVERRRRHRTSAEIPLPKSNSHYSPSTEVQTNSSNKTHVTVYSLTNQNINRVESQQREILSNTLGSIDTHVIVSPVQASRCDQITTKNDSQTVRFDQNGNVNLREQLTDALCRRLHEPLMFMNRGMCWGNCRGGSPCFPSNGLPFSHPGHLFPSAPFEQQQQQQPRESSEQKQSPHMGDASETMSNSYSVSGSARSIGDETGVLSQQESNDQHEPSESNVSFLSDHNRSPSQQSTRTIERNGQLIEDAKVLVNDLIQNAQKKYEILALANIEQDSSDNVIDTSKEKFESVSMPSESVQQELPDGAGRLCQQLCDKLNLSDSDQVTQILRVLASNAPHVLKEQQQPTNEKVLIEGNTLCSQLLLHPPFKPKRLIHLCPDGGIQILSAIDDDSKDHLSGKQHYQLNYSNSALTTPVKLNTNYWPDETSLALEYETTTAIDLLNDVKRRMLDHSSSPQASDSTDDIQVDRVFVNNNSILSIQQDDSWLSYNDKVNQLTDALVKNCLTGRSECTPALSTEIQPGSVSPRNAIINVGLDDQTVTINSSDEENSLPELVFKRIIVPENFTNDPLTEISNRLTDNKNKTLQHTSVDLGFVRKQQRRSRSRRL